MRENNYGGNSNYENQGGSRKNSQGKRGNGRIQSSTQNRSTRKSISNANVNSRKIVTNNNSPGKVKKRNKGLIKIVANKFFKKSGVELIRYKEGVDRLFLIFVVILLCFGTVMVFSASYANALQYYGDSYFFAKKQVLMASIGIMAMIITSYIADYRIIEKLTVPFFAFVILLNYLTPFFGKVTNGTPRWFRIMGLQFQPSELLKLAVVCLFSLYITKIGDKMRTFKWGILFPVIIVGTIAGAMYLQSHFSGLIIIAGLCISLIFIGGAPTTWLGGFTAAGAAGIAYVILFTPYAKDRIDAWRNPFNYPKDEGWQTIQSLYAIASGGLLGVGLGNSKQKYLFLPEPQNDFIFAIVCEELGFVGALLIIALFVLLIWRGFVIAYHAPDRFSSLVVMGIILKVAIQFLLNIAVVTNAVPNTGISLPFFSYGGTALIVLLAEMGVILSISRYSYQDKV